ncbi:MAG: glycosyltransferase family 39 protein [Candidatus Omnitrophica bacterium]|nr:glycosyltransferase family 39 protein [Candidatus Omnitrophota bacterium]
MKNKTIDLIVVSVIAGFVFLCGLGAMGLTDPDERFYAQSAKEMLDRGDWITPCIFDKPQFEKPIFYYWLVMISYKVFGVNEAAARLPSALFGVLGTIGVYYIGWLLFSRRTGFYAALVMTTSIMYIILARACVTDMVLCVFIVYVFLFYLTGYISGHNKLLYLAAAGTAGLAVLTKGPIGLILPAAIISIFVVLIKDGKALLRFPLISGSILFLAVSAPWYFMMYKIHGMTFIDHFFGFQNITRFLSPEHKIGDVVYYYVPILLGGFLPWSIFLPYGLWRIARDDRPMFRWHLFLLVWAGVFFIFFSLSRTKLPTYIFPLFPALAVFMGRYLDRMIAGGGPMKMPERVSSGLYCAVFPVTMAVFYAVAMKKYTVMEGAILKTGVVLTAMAVVSLVMLVLKKRALFYHSIIATLCLAVIPITVFLSLPITRYESAKYLVAEIKKHIRPGDLVGAETDYRRGVAFYLGRNDVPDIHLHDTMTKFFQHDQRVWGIIKDKNHRALYTDKRNPYQLPTYVIYQYGKRDIVSNKIPDDGDYVKMRSREEPY